MQIFYHSTRDRSKKFTSSECILKGLSDDGGLFVTDAIDSIHFDYRQLIGKTYQEIAKTVFQQFFTDFITKVSGTDMTPQTSVSLLLFPIRRVYSPCSRIHAACSSS